VTALGQFTIGTDNALPVQMGSVKAEVRGQTSEVRLSWTTTTETDNAGWSVERRSVSREYAVGSREKDEWKDVGFVEGAGTSTSPHVYMFIDDISRSAIRNSQSRFVYRLRQIDRSGSSSYSHEVEVEIGTAPREFALGQNFPNPFNPATSIEFTLADDGPVTLRIYDAIGRLVATPFEGSAVAGTYHRVLFDAHQFSSGLYFYRLDAGRRSAVRKMTLMK
jgi:hypothetical protein